jgi:hypothetical protein
MKFTYMKTPLQRYTFKNRRIREWVESHVEGRVLNLFAGKTLLSCHDTLAIIERLNETHPG